MGQWWDGTGTPPPFVTNKQRSKRRTTRIDLTCKPETKVHMKQWANELFLDTPSALLEYLVEKHQQGLLFITERQDFFAGMARTLELRCEKVAAEAGEKAATHVLADHGLVDSPYRR